MNDHLTVSGPARNEPNPGQALLAATMDPAVPDSRVLTLITVIQQHRHDLGSTPGVANAPHLPADDQGRTPLMHASRLHGLACVQALIATTDPQARDRNQATALMHAAQGSRTENLQALLPVSDPHASNEQGWTALAYAATWAREASTSVLIPWATPDELADALMLTLVNRRRQTALLLINALPAEALAPASALVSSSLHPGKDATLIAELNNALHHRERDVLARAIDAVRPVGERPMLPTVRPRL